MVAQNRAHGGTALAEAVRAAYREGQSDYLLEPLILADARGEPLGPIEDGDAVIFCCRRGEREIQLTEAFTEAGFSHFPRRAVQDLTFVILTRYHEKFNHLPIAFAPLEIPGALGEIVSRAGLRQLRVAESEKFAHVTFFFNDGRHQPFAGEQDVCIPSPKGIPFEQVPALSLLQVADAVIDGIESGHDLIVTNFANGDVIGHTPNCRAKVQCAEIVDAQVGRVVEAALAANYVVLVTADHGNLEEMLHPDGSPHVAHTANPVALLAIDRHAPTPFDLSDGKLADVAPTILSFLGIEQPPEMSGQRLLKGAGEGQPRRVLLIILDGWGIGRRDSSNPIYLARTPAWDALTGAFPPARLQAAGSAVGLQAGKAGNSEAGHLNLGAGRIVLQDDSRLELAMEDGSFFSNPILRRTITETGARQSTLHLIALLSEKSSHGSSDYPLALLKMAKASGLERVNLHLIFDGRSTEPGSAPDMLTKFERQIAEIGIGQIVSGVGRGLALDRDGNYAKTRRAYEAMVSGAGRRWPANARG